MTIRPATTQDHEVIWEILKAVVATGDTYVFNPDSSQDKMMAFWCDPDAHVYIAEDGSRIVGTYRIKANQPDRGSHIANGAYMVSPQAKGQGIGRSMGIHSLEQARQLGYHAVQFNFVIKTNTAAVNLWKSLGFEIVGEIPLAFKHQTLGYVNVYIMYKSLQ